MAQTIYKSWFVDFEPWNGEQPSDWHLGNLGDIAEAIYIGGTPNTNNSLYWDGGISWLSSGETRSRFIIGTEKTITQQGVNNSSTKFAHRDDVVMASAGQGFTRGQTSFLLIDTYINQSVIAISGGIFAVYLFLNLIGRYEELRAISDSSSIRGSITTKMLAGFPMLIPTKDTIKEFSSLIWPLIDQIENNLLESANLAALRNVLLPRLMSGELSFADL
ncbi:MAG TPA: restriction endonuclease subunit S [Desulfitobacteriaceae bacterium]|nr:restriction endonuclease subunit S [Desulfitobacteriaceae bacterium]